MVSMEDVIEMVPETRRPGPAHEEMDGWTERRANSTGFMVGLEGMESLTSA